MPKVTHLTDAFYEELSQITGHLQEGLLPQDYKRFYKLVIRKDLATATRYLEGLYEEYTEVDVYELARIRKREGQEILLGYIQFRIDMCQWLGEAVSTWIKLMLKAGGSKRAGRLTRKAQMKLPATKPRTYPKQPRKAAADQ